MDEAREKKLLSFLETATFVERLAELGGERRMELLYAIQDELLADPERGDLVKGLSGVRKARIAPQPDRKARAAAIAIFTFISRCVGGFICCTSSISVSGRT